MLFVKYDKYQVAAGRLHAGPAPKLRIANGTHAAVAHAMALSVLPWTDTLALGPAAVAALMPYLGALIATQILPAAAEFGAEDACTIWEGLRTRLTQTEFGLSTSSSFRTERQRGNPPCGPRSAPAEMESGGINGAGTGNDSRVPDADHRGSRGRQGRSLSGLTRSVCSDRRKDEDLV